MKAYRTLAQYPALKIFSDGTIRGSYGRTLKGQLTKEGRIRIGCRHRDGSLRYVLVSRLICEAFHGESPTPSHQAAHNNGDPLDNRAENLRWATAKENTADRIIHGTDLRGSDHPRAKLADDDVRKIMIALDQGVPGTRLAEQFGVGKAQISSIKHRRSWAHIPWPESGEAKIIMPKKLSEEDRLSEMLTIVTTPGMRARLDDAADRRETKTAYIARQAFRAWLDKNEPMGQQEQDALTAAYLASKARKEGTGS